MNFLKTHQNTILFSITIIIFFAFCFMLLYRLGVHPMIDWDESIYGQVAKDSLQNKNLLNFAYFGKAWYEKPPLGLWLVSASYAIGGINDWSARVPSVLGAIAMVALSMRWVWELRKSYMAVILTIASYFIMFPFITAAYFLNLDTIVGFFVLFSLYSWWKAKNDHTWYLFFGLGIGLGVLTKNVVGLFPIIPILIHSLFGWDFSFLKEKKFWYGVLISGVVILPWHIYQSVVVGKAFWDNYLFYHVFQRYSTSLESNGAPFLYFFDIVFLRYYLALVIFGGSVLVSVYYSLKNLGLRFILICAVSLFLVFSSSITKLPSYITMTLPLIVMIAGISLANIIGLAPKKWMRTLVVAILILSFVYTGYAFNTYKLAQGEYAEQYLDNRAVGEFLRNYRTDLPVYTNFPYLNLGIGYYANRKVIQITDTEMIGRATERVFHTKNQSVFLGENYLVIKR